MVADCQTHSQIVSANCRQSSIQTRVAECQTHSQTVSVDCTVQTIRHPTRVADLDSFADTQTADNQLSADTQTMVADYQTHSQTLRQCLQASATSCRQTHS